MYVANTIEKYNMINTFYRKCAYYSNVFINDQTEKRPLNIKVFQIYIYVYIYSITNKNPNNDHPICLSGGRGVICVLFHEIQH